LAAAVSPLVDVKINFGFNSIYKYTVFDIELTGRQFMIEPGLD